MKKCPKCKAEIQEEARFCLYCMTSFEEKQTIETPKENNKRWLIIIAAVLVLVLIVACIFLFNQKDSQANGENDTSSTSSISSDLDTSADNNKTTSEPQNSESRGNETSTPTSSNQTQTSSKNEGNTTNSTSGNTATNNSSSGTSTNNITTSDSSQNSTTSNNTTTNNTSTNSSSQNSTTTNNTTTNSTTTNNNSTSSTSSNNKTESNNSGSSSTTTTTPSETTTITYTYRDAKYGDDFSVGANLENSVVITGVKTASPNGEYKIPDTIDGKKVVAIMGLAFCDEGISSTVKKVIVPTNVKTIWNNAFANCYNLTDIYFCGNSIYTESNAFPEKTKRNGTLTIHCSANCSDRNYRYYKNSASYYDAEYEEWNG